MKPLRIGTRGSDLAMWQANFVAAALRRAEPKLETVLEVIHTSGDFAAEDHFSGMESSGFFTKEIETALLESRIDLAVHSLKDLPTDLPAGLTLGAILEREDPADALISKSGASLAALPHAARVLTGAPRRQALVLHERPDLVCLPVRGNIPTRLATFRESDADAIILARAGLVRLSLVREITQRLDPETFIPACGQGALAVEIRLHDARAAALCAKLEHPPTRLATAAERAFLAALGAGCRVAAGAWARFDGPSILVITGMASSLDGTAFFRGGRSGVTTTASEAANVGIHLADELRASGAAAVLRASREAPPRPPRRIA